jgi:hypothetical protein
LEDDGGVEGKVEEGGDVRGLRGEGQGLRCAAKEERC